MKAEVVSPMLREATALRQCIFEQGDENDFTILYLSILIIVTFRELLKALNRVLRLSNLCASSIPSKIPQNCHGIAGANQRNERVLSFCDLSPQILLAK